ncbi:hypothetical protein [uncultured Chryseobacterium sp.]|uniref:hypothetical protein n=1 Tax=uncultured Chryseobacterium sp. TaxID=259322 RepID=UPI0025E0AECB|nr:hypothetical protein [uncultured Chryseobacterium sp.]
MKKITLLTLLPLSAVLYSQVGINNNLPKATLDITAKTTDGSKPEGIIAPRLTGDQIKSADAQYGSDQRGAIVYALAAVSTASTKTANITAEGYYFFDGNLWKAVGSGIGDNLGNHSATQDLAMNNFAIQLGAAGGNSNKIVYNATIDGPVITGNAGGALGTQSGGAAKNVLTWNSAGSVEVNGNSTNAVSYNAGTGVNIDYVSSNLAYTTANAGNTFNLTGIKDGGTYSLAVKGTVSGTASFTAPSGFTVKYANSRPSTSGKETVYTFVVIGSTVYVYMSAGF